MLLKNFFAKLKNIEIDSKIKKIMKIGLHVSSILSLIATVILFTYLNFTKTLTTFYLGLFTLKISLTLASAFIIAGLSTDRIKKELF